LRIDMHVHTHYSSDSNLQLSDIIEVIKKGKIDAVAITDHNEIAGAKELQQIATFPVIIGEEIMTAEGEIIGYFLSEKIKPNLPLIETISMIKEQNGLVAVPHPFDRLRSSALKLDSLYVMAEHTDLIEIFNSRNIFAHDNRLARLYAEKKGLPGIAGSDAHTKTEIGAAYIEIEEYFGAQEFLKKVRNASICAQKSSITVHLATKANKIRQRINNSRHNSF
jgi:predicted metal-dependent phosphoesterase TrpH